MGQIGVTHPLCPLNTHCPFVLCTGSASSMPKQPVPPYEMHLDRMACPESIGGGIPSGPRPRGGVCVGRYSHSGQFYEKGEQKMNSVECSVSLDTNDYVCNLS